MEDVDKQPEEWKTALQDLLFFVEKFEGRDNVEGHDTNSTQQQKNNARNNQQEEQTSQDVIHENQNSTTTVQQNQYKNGKTDTATLAVATGMTYMPSTRELGYLNQTNLLRKDFKIRGVIGNAEQKNRSSFVSLSHKQMMEKWPHIVKRK